MGGKRSGNRPLGTTRHVFRENDFDQEKKDSKGSPVRFHSPAVYRRDPDPEEYGLSGETLSTQLKGGASFHHRRTGGQLWIAYEPVWAIGVNSIPADSDYVG